MNKDSDNKNEYSGVFSSLADLAEGDTGEHSIFADAVYEREIQANKLTDSLMSGYKWMTHHLGDRQKQLSKDTFRTFNKNNELIEDYARGNYGKVMSHPQIFHTYSDDITEQVTKAILHNPKLAAIVHNKSDKDLVIIVNDISKRVKDNLQKNKFVTVNGSVNVPYTSQITIKRKPIPGSTEPVDEVITLNGEIALHKSNAETQIKHIEMGQPGLQNRINETEKVLNDRAKKGDVKFDSNGTKMVFNGLKWVAVGLGAYQVWQNKDAIPGAIQSALQSNDTTSLKSDSEPTESDTNTSSPYHPNESSPEAIGKYNPGGVSPSSPQQGASQSAWDQLRSKPSSSRKTTTDTEDGWWNSSSGNRSYDEFGYVGSENDSWGRYAQKQPAANYDEMNDDALAEAGAEHVMAAENLLAYYGLGDNSQPAEKIVPSLLLGNFDGMSYDEYKKSHTPEETRRAMQRFQQSLTMFNNEMSRMAKNLESVYQERQKRFESKSNTQTGNQNNEPSK